MLPCLEVTGARGYQDENLLLPLMIRTLSFSPSPASAITDDPPAIALLQALQAGLEKELPALQFRLWSLLEDCIGLLIALHTEFLPWFLGAEMEWHSVDGKVLSLYQVPEGILLLVYVHGMEEVMLKTVAVFKAFFKKK
jgi:hypothetical protein